ncbi:secreted protein [gut metagenome]|uniref:Secreted protein n=1 Tax=gut metagenome TaxID=749906 RepID=J9CST6_9ZZZZ
MKPSKRRVLPRARSAASRSLRPSAMASRTAPPVPMARLAACKNAASGQATLMAARPASPRFCPIKNPSTIIKKLFSSWLSMLGNAKCQNFFSIPCKIVPPEIRILWGSLYPNQFKNASGHIKLKTSVESCSTAGFLKRLRI